jgi:hypothetical protein
MTRLRRYLGTALAGTAALLSACTVPDWVQPSFDRGQGTSVALGVQATASALMREIEALPRSTCRPPTRLEAPFTTQSRVEYVRKGPGLPVERIVETLTLRIDDQTNGSARHVVTARLPDGRYTVRTLETRHVDGLWYRAIDDAFTDASRIPDIAAEFRTEQFRLVDDLLRLVAVQGGRLVQPGRMDPLCGAPVQLDVRAQVEGRVRWRNDGRDGWLRFTDEDGIAIYAVFDERTGAGAEPVVAPDTLHPIEADTSWAELEAFARRGIDDGWMLPPRNPAGDEGSAAPP